MEFMGPIASAQMMSGAADGGFLLQEDGSFLLLEDGSKIILE